VSRFKNAISGLVSQAVAWLKSLGLLRIIDGYFRRTPRLLNHNRPLFGVVSRFTASIVAIAALAIAFGAHGALQLVALVVVAIAGLYVIVEDLIGEARSKSHNGESSSAIPAPDVRPASAHIRDALAVLELTGMRIIDRHDDKSIIMVPLADWTDATRRLWNAVYQLEGRPPTRNTTTRQRLAEVDSARDRERLHLLAARES